MRNPEVLSSKLSEGTFGPALVAFCDPHHVWKENLSSLSDKPDLSGLCPACFGSITVLVRVSTSRIDGRLALAQLDIL